jgi:hypothetical protein
MDLSKDSEVCSDPFVWRGTKENRMRLVAVIAFGLLSCSSSFACPPSALIGQTGWIE